MLGVLEYVKENKNMTKREMEDVKRKQTPRDKKQPKWETNGKEWHRLNTAGKKPVHPLKDLTGETI